MTTKPRPQLPSDKLWEKKAEELESSSLERIKSTSEKWLGSITALAGVFGIIVFINGPSDITTLTPINRIGVAILLLFAVISTFTAILLAALAAQGIPSKIWSSGSILRRESIKLADKSAKLLNWSRFMVLPSVICLAIAIALMWFGEKEVKDKSENFIAIYATGEVICGKLALSDQGVLSLKAPNGVTQILENIESLEVVSVCPY